MVKKGLGSSVVKSLVRIKALPKSATSAPDNRPTAKEHYESMATQKNTHMRELGDIVLVDNMITRGTTLIGAANRLAESYPKARIKAFAMI